MSNFRGWHRVGGAEPVRIPNVPEVTEDEDTEEMDPHVMRTIRLRARVRNHTHRDMPRPSDGRP